MHEDRLLKLADLLERDAKNPTGLKFDLGTWAAPSEKFEKWQAIGFNADDLGVDGEEGHINIPVRHDKLPKVSCGTTACALGLAMLSGEFAEWGLAGSAEFTSNGNVQLSPSCDGETGFEAGAALFGISRNDSMYLFDPMSYGDDAPREAKGEILVAQRIRDFVAGRIEEKYHPDTRGQDED